MISLDDCPLLDTPLRKDLAPEDQARYLHDFPALLWRVEPARSRIEFLNSHQLAVLGEASRLFMQNPELRRRMVLPEDAHVLQGFSEKMQAGQPATAAFRIRGEGGAVRWLKLSGQPQGQDGRFYQGYLLDVTEPVEASHAALMRDAETQVAIELAPQPALLVEYDTRKVAAMNAAALDLFGYGRDEAPRLGLGDLLHPGLGDALHRAWEDLLFTRAWEGRLSFARKTRAVFSADATARALACKGRRLARISLTRVEAGEPAPAPGAGPRGAALTAYVRDLEERLAGLSRMEDILEVFLARRLPGLDWQGVMFSDIHARRNKVFVYGAGQPFAATSLGEMFSYEGTIAQHIAQFGLDHLIVDDTLESIKAIDWALFIPKGIRSYFAKAFHTRGVMRAVLILCSTAPRAFPAERLDDYAALYRPFAAAVERWRAARRTARKSARNRF